VSRTIHYEADEIYSYVNHDVLLDKGNTLMLYV